jgi:hypothetical protein
MSSTPIHIDIVEPSSFDIVACKIALHRKNLILVNFYIPPASSSEQYSALADAITSVQKSAEVGDELLIYGDANLNGVHWFPSEDCEGVLEPVNIRNAFIDFLAKIYSLGVYQINNRTDSFGNVLDVVFTSIISNVILDTAVQTLTSKTSDFHKILSLQYFYNDYSMSPVSNKTIKYDFSNADYRTINRRLADLTLPEANIDADDYASLFLSRLIEIIDENTPKRISTRLSCAPHMDKTLRVLRNRRNIRGVPRGGRGGRAAPGVTLFKRKHF